MNQLSALFDLIGQALMPPVMCFLLAGLVIALLDVGDHVGERIVRWRGRAARAELERICMRAGLNKLPGLKPGGALGATTELWSERPLTPGMIERGLDQLEDRFERQLQRTTALLRVGPALGLLGTLIPMGPALADLAAGRLDTMAAKLTLAFSTTVVGLLISILATFVTLSKRRIYGEELRLARTLADRLLDQPPTEAP
jgi:hypothetical protein